MYEYTELCIIKFSNSAISNDFREFVLLAFRYAKNVLGTQYQTNVCWVKTIVYKLVKEQECDAETAF